jgi:hypothetical protein
MKTKIQLEVEFILKKIDYYFDRRRKLLKKDTLSKKQQRELNALIYFEENFPLSKDVEINDGYKMLKEFAKKIGKNKK